MDGEQPVCQLVSESVSQIARRSNSRPTNRGHNDTVVVTVNRSLLDGVTGGPHKMMSLWVGGIALVARMAKYPCPESSRVIKYAENV